jgi:hypothetical protein
LLLASFNELGELWLVSMTARAQSKLSLICRRKPSGTDNTIRELADDFQSRSEPRRQIVTLDQNAVETQMKGELADFPLLPADLDKGILCVVAQYSHAQLSRVL